MAGMPVDITGQYTSSVKIYHNIVATFGLQSHNSIKNKHVKLITKQGVNKDELIWTCSFYGTKHDAHSSCRND